jgi:hypothetical protein
MHWRREAYAKKKADKKTEVGGDVTQQLGIVCLVAKAVIVFALCLLTIRNPGTQVDFVDEQAIGAMDFGECTDKKAEDKNEVVVDASQQPGIVGLQPKAVVVFKRSAS